MKLYNWKGFDRRRTINSVCKKYNIKNYEINSDGSINVDGGVYLRNKELKDIPLIFNEVTGYFTCGYNKLTSLEGSPIKCRDFFCVGNNLTNLNFSPKYVYGNFNCSENNITTLVGCPEYVSGVFDCSYNKLYDVYGFPEGFSNPIDIVGNPVNNIIKLFKDVEIHIVIEKLNSYNVIRNKKVNLQLLSYCFEELSLSFSEIKYIEGYEV